MECSRGHREIKRVYLFKQTRKHSAKYYIIFVAVEITKYLPNMLFNFYIIVS